MTTAQAPAAGAILVRTLGRRDYEPVYRAMRAFTEARTPATPDELWLVEHPPVYTMGLKGHARAPRAISGVPVVPVDRGGDITYHGPGQIVVYLLLDLARRGLGPKALVRRIEQSVIDLLADYGLAATRRAGAPGVYVDGKKISALGLRVRAGRCYHGLSLNVGMDLAPFTRIDPCGYPGLAVTELAALGITDECATVRDRLCAGLLRGLGYNDGQFTDVFPAA